ncbi:MAG: DUF885 domain-containing protein [Sphingomonas sp.]|nr:MAG: DUF885 domain-containing protein [Sphingomonas sp.]
MVSRRTLLAGAAATFVAGAGAAATPDIVAMLDAAAAERDPASALALLSPLDARGLPPGLAFDLAAARSGLALDAALADVKGAARYPLQLKRMLGDDASPDAARTRLEAELSRLLGRADRLFRRLGDTQDGIGARYSRLWRDGRYLYPDSEPGRARAVADMNATLGRFRAMLPAAFAPLPPTCLNVSVRALTPEEIAAGKGGYRILPEAGRPGFYVVDLKEIGRRPSWTLPSAVAHELLPGHMIQLPLAEAARPHPLRLRYTPAYAEGWAIHAEELAGRLGTFADPRHELGHIHWLLFRVTRGLVDLGIRQGGWSAAEARSRLVGWMGEPAYFALFDPDLERTARDPAIRTAEAMTWLAIADRSRDLRGAALRGLHTALLANGPLRSEAIARMKAA